MLEIDGPLEADGSALLGSMVAAVVTDCPAVPLLMVTINWLPCTRER